MNMFSYVHLSLGDSTLRMIVFIDAGQYLFVTIQFTDTIMIIDYIEKTLNFIWTSQVTLLLINIEIPWNQPIWSQYQITL